jgi:hypothetical protein
MKSATRCLIGRGTRLTAIWMQLAPAVIGTSNTYPTNRKITTAWMASGPHAPRLACAHWSCVLHLSFRPPMTARAPRRELHRFVIRWPDDAFCTICRDPHNDAHYVLLVGGIFAVIEPRTGKGKAEREAMLRQLESLWAAVRRACMYRPNSCRTFAEHLVGFAGASLRKHRYRRRRRPRSLKGVR